MQRKKDQAPFKFIVPSSVRNTLYDQISASNLYKMPLPSLTQTYKRLEPSKISQKKKIKEKINILTNFLKKSKSINKAYK